MKGKRSIGTTVGMKRWYSRMKKCGDCRKVYLVTTEAHNRGLCAKCYKPVQIETGEWYFAGCFIQEVVMPQIFAKYEVFKDDEAQTHVGHYKTFREAQRAARENEVKNPANGLSAYVNLKTLKL